MKDFAKRLARLEQVIAGERIYVLRGPADMETDAAIAAVGIKPQPLDLVIYCRNFGDEGVAPELVHVRRAA